MEKVIYLDGNSLTVQDVVDICRNGAKVALTEEAKNGSVLQCWQSKEFKGILAISVNWVI